MKKINFTTEQREFIKTQVINGKSQKNIISMLKEQFNISCGLTTIQNIYKELGVGGKAKSKVDEDELILYIIDGLSYDNIANQMNINIDVLKTFISNHNILNKVERKKSKLHNWYGNDTVDLRKITDESIDDIEQYLNCKLEKNAIVTIDNKKFIFDFYSKEYNIAFLCCLYNPEKHPGLDRTELPNRKHAIPDKVQWEWILKITDAEQIQNIDRPIEIVSYFYWDSKVTANHINDIMTYPEHVNGKEEKIKSSKMYLENVISVEKPTYYYVDEPEENKSIETKRLDCFKYENILYDPEGFRLMDFDTLILNIDPNTGCKLTTEQKDTLLKDIKLYLNDMYKHYMEYSKNEEKIKTFGIDKWNYYCARDLYAYIKRNFNNLIAF